MDTLNDTFGALLRKAEALGPGEWFKCEDLLIQRTRSTGRLRCADDNINAGPDHARFWRGDFETILREAVECRADWTKAGYFASRFIRAAMA